MTNQLIKSNETFSLTPRNLDEAMKYSEMLARSTIVPKGYQGKSGDILIAVQMGSELGLKPMQSLQSIAVINGKPSIYGDVLIALVRAHPDFEDMREYFDDKTQSSICAIKRKNQSEHISSFSIEDAKKAGLWNKPGPWTQYPKRMLQMRARGFGLRDVFADALQGLILAEEAMDYKDITPGIDNVNKSYDSTTDKLIDKLSISTLAEIEPNIEEPIEELRILPTSGERLSMMIMQYNVPDDLIDKWLKAGKVNKINELPEEAMQKCMDYININFA